MIRAIRFLRSFQKKLNAEIRPGNSIFIAEAQFDVQVFSPPREARATLILIHGIHPNGPFDPRFLAFAKTCAEAGFLVLAPDISPLRNFQISLEVKDQIIRLVQALPEYFDATALNNIGLLAISYGAGPAFLAAAELQKVNYLISIGGYYNLHHAIEFLITGRHRGAETVASRAPQWWGRMIFALHHLDALAPAEDRTLLQEILLSRLTLQEPSSKEPLLTSSGATFLNSLHSGLSQERTADFLRSAEQHRQLFEDLSPEHMLHRLNPNTRIYLLHGRTDTLIPFEETLELADQFKHLGFKKVRALTTASLTHVDLDLSKRFLEGFQLVGWIQSVLREATCGAQASSLH